MVGGSGDSLEDDLAGLAVFGVKKIEIVFPAGCWQKDEGNGLSGK